VPLLLQNFLINDTRLAVWDIKETEAFFLEQVPVNNAITHPHKRLQHLAGRYLLQYMFAAFPYHLIEIASTRKPFLPGDAFHFSISHCSNFAAAIAGADARVGFDVEVITPRVHKIKHKFLSAAELAFVNGYSAGQHNILLTLLWSAKEAMYKWYGLGEVDFIENMLTLPFHFAQSGTIPCMFTNSTLAEHLTLQYQILQGIILVWVASPAQ